MFFTKTLLPSQKKYVVLACCSLAIHRKLVVMHVCTEKNVLNIMYAETSIANVYANIATTRMCLAIVCFLNLGNAIVIQNPHMFVTIAFLTKHVLLTNMFIVLLDPNRNMRGL
jgi:hypothetical protein